LGCQWTPRLFFPELNLNPYLMNISDIKALLANDDPQVRMRGLVALKDYDQEAAVPVLVEHWQDEAFLVRSFVAMGLGRKRNEQAYSVLLEMLSVESDNNVQAEIANSLGLYGAVSGERLVRLFYDNENWLVRRSILAIMPEMDYSDGLLTVATAALQDKDLTIVHAGIATLGALAGTPQAQTALDALLPYLTAEDWRSRLYLAYALKPFLSDHASATAEQLAQKEAASEALSQLRQDSHHKVVAATLEGLLPS